MPDLYTFQGIQTPVDLTECLGAHRQLRHWRQVCVERMGPEAGHDHAVDAVGSWLDEEGAAWVRARKECIDEVVGAWDELATTWRAGKDRATVEDRLRTLPDRLVSGLPFLSDARAHVDAAMRVGFLVDLTVPVAAARPRPADLRDLRLRLEAGLPAAFVRSLCDCDRVGVSLGRFITKRLPDLLDAVVCDTASPEEREPCGWCEVGHGRIGAVLGGTQLLVANTWACPEPRTRVQLQHRAVEGIAVAPAVGLGVWGPWAPTLWNLEAQGRVCGFDDVPLEFCGTAAFSPDGRRLAAGALGFAVWDLATKAPLLVEDEFTDEGVHALVFSPCGGFVYAGCEDGSLRAYDLADGRAVWTAWSDDAIHALTVGPDGRHLLAASRAGEICMHDLRDGRVLTRQTLSARGAHAVAISPDGRRMVGGGGGELQRGGPAALEPTERPLRVWQFMGDCTVKDLVGHTHAVVGVGFLDNGARIASASEDGTVRLWDAETGAQVDQIDLAGVRDYPTALATDGQQRVWIGTNGGWVLELEAGLIIGSGRP